MGIANGWRTVMVRHARPAKAKDSYHARALIDPGRTMVIEVAFDDAEIIEPWLDGTMASPPGPWIVTVHFHGEPWVHVLTSSPDLLPVERLGATAELRVLAAWQDAAGGATRLVAYKRGKLVTDVADASDAAIAKHFRAADATPRRLAVRREDNRLRLVDESGAALRASDLQEVTIRKLAPLTAAESRASVRLLAAIKRGDLARVERALADGANLEFVPDSGSSPLGLAVFNRDRGDWRGVVRALVDAGAPIAGYWWEEPPVTQAVSNFFSDDANVAMVKLLAELGADLNATVSRDARYAGATPLHLAVLFHHVELVRWLVTNGARLEIIETERGRTPLALAEQLAAAPTPDRAACEAIAELLRRASSALQAERGRS